MTAFNVVRFRVKPGQEARFVEAHRNARPEFKGFVGGSLVKTGDQPYCMIGEWRNFQSLAAARPQMIAILDGFRDPLEDLGVTEPVSGEVVVKLTGAWAAKKRRAKARRPAKRAAAKRKR